ncbi:MAG: DUF4139 domain-containing protein [Candidatus Obscuribacterales bacterium]|nr:DUF4139 domain-containing protein [Candidatus Obscuribacterales bacterium]
MFDERCEKRGNRKLFGCAKLSLSLAVGTLVSFGYSNSAQAEEIRLSESQGVSITIYNQNFGLVRDTRNITLQNGINDVRFEDVAGHIDPTSVSFQSLTAPNSVVVREQNYQYDLMDQNTILSKSVGKELKFKQFLPGGSVTEFSGTLLNSPNATVYDANGGNVRTSTGLVVKTADGIVLNPTGQISLGALPPGLVSKPSLLWKIESTKAGDHKTEIAYQTSGINWKCDYVALVNKDDNQADLVSWVTIDNKSGGAYKNAALKLLAGDVHKIQPAPVSYGMVSSMKAGRAAAPEPQFQEQSFAEYHLYTLQGKTTVAENETKQMSLFNASEIPIRKLFIYEPSKSIYPYGGGNTSQEKVQVKFELANTEKNHLGIPMPKGKVRVYKKDQDGALQFIGEDEIDHTPRDEKVRLYIGDAFDLVGEHKQVSYNRVSDRVQRYTYEISLRNHKKDDVTITAVEHSYGDWTILNSSMEYTKKDSHTFEFNVKVPANGETKVNYEIEIRY